MQVTPLRILYSVQPATGHLQPLVPICQELIGRGHEVLVACAPAFQATVEKFGLTGIPIGLDWLRSEPERYFPELRAIEPHRRYAWILKNIYARDAAHAALPDLERLCTEWHPDVVIRDQMDFASWLVAERRGIPHLSYGYGLGFQEKDREMAGPALAALRAHAGLPPDPELATLFRYMRFEFAPPDYLPPGSTITPRTHHLRYQPIDAYQDAVAPEWHDDRCGDRLLVVATLGNNYNRTPGVFEAIIAALADQPFDVLLLTGHNRPVDEFGQLPRNVEIRPYVPLSQVIPKAAALICHSGFNTVMTAVLAGTPMVLIPIDSDQPASAVQCGKLGVGTLLQHDRLDAESIRAAVWSVIRAPSYRQAAAALCKASHKLPDTDAAATLIEGMARGHNSDVL